MIWTQSNLNLDQAQLKAQHNFFNTVANGPNMTARSHTLKKKWKERKLLNKKGNLG